MKKSLLTLSLGLTALIATASQENPIAQWGNLFGGAITSGDQSISIALSDAGNILWLNTANTDEASKSVYYAGEEIYSSPFKTNNLTLLSTDSDGALKWEAHSTTTDAVSGQGGIATDAEGNVIFTAKVRQANDDYMNLIGADGAEKTFGDKSEKRYYQILVAKLSAAGEIKWVKLFEQSTAPAPAASGNNADFTSDAVSVSAISVDPAGNIYVGGNYRTDMTIDDVTLHPENVDAWTGDSQTACGNMFIVKLNPDGQYLASVTGVGDIKGVSAIQALTWNDDKLYIYGYAKGEGSFTFAGENITPTDVNSPIIGRLTSDLKADWIKCCPGATVDGKSALQNVGLSVYGDNLWICGQYNQKISDPTQSDKFVTATQGSIREGFVIKFDKNDGLWLASADSRTDFPEITKISGYFKVLQSTKNLDVAYIFGYTMDATQGIFLREYNALTLEPNIADAWNIATGGGVPSCIAADYDEESSSLYITGRGNKAFTLMGNPDITTEATNAWDVLMAKYTISVPSALIDTMISADIDMPEDIYDITGRHVGNTTKGLTPGIYISKNKKFIVR